MNYAIFKKYIFITAIMIDSTKKNIDELIVKDNPNKQPKKERKDYLKK